MGLHLLVVLYVSSLFHTPSHSSSQPHETPSYPLLPLTCADGYHLAELNYPVNGLTCHPSPNDGHAFLPPCLGINTIKYSAVTALLTAGGLVGSALSDRVVRSEGVSGGIAWTGWLNLLGALMMAAAPHWVVLAAGR